MMQEERKATKNYWYISQVGFSALLLRFERDVGLIEICAALQVGWALCIIGFGLMTMISATSSRALYESLPVLVGGHLSLVFLRAWKLTRVNHRNWLWYTLYFPDLSDPRANQTFSECRGTGFLELHALGESVLLNGRVLE